MNDDEDEDTKCGNRKKAANNSNLRSRSENIRWPNPIDEFTITENTNGELQLSLKKDKAGHIELCAMVCIIEEKYFDYDDANRKRD